MQLQFQTRIFILVFKIYVVLLAIYYNTSLTFWLFTLLPANCTDKHCQDSLRSSFICSFHPSVFSNNTLNILAAIHNEGISSTDGTELRCLYSLLAESTCAWVQTPESFLGSALPIHMYLFGLMYLFIFVTVFKCFIMKDISAFFPELARS